jgi:hypothetical protein
LKGCEVPPGTYEHKSTIDELIKKKVSNRGPYDLFSLDRSDAPKTGHYTKVVKWNLGPGQYNIPSFTDDLVNYSKGKHGKFGKIAQYPVHSGDRLSIEHTSLQPKDPLFPGPGDYTPGDMSKVKSNPPPFLISTSRTDKRSNKFFLRNFVSLRLKIKNQEFILCLFLRIRSVLVVMIFKDLKRVKIKTEINLFLYQKHLKLVNRKKRSF